MCDLFLKTLLYSHGWWDLLVFVHAGQAIATPGVTVLARLGSLLGFPMRFAY